MLTQAKRWGALLAQLDQHGDLGNAEFSSHRKVLGAAVLKAKHTLKTWLTPVLQRQTAFNQASHQLLTELADQVSKMSRELDQLRARDEGFQLRRGELAALRAELQALQRENHASLDHLEASLTAALGRLEALLGAPPVHPLPDEPPADPDQPRRQGRLSLLP